jgi:hypothetical protein
LQAGRREAKQRHDGEDTDLVPREHGSLNTVWHFELQVFLCSTGKAKSKSIVNVILGKKQKEILHENFERQKEKQSKKRE